MRGVRGFLVGVLALVTLEVLVTNAGATGRVSGFFGGVSKAVNWVLDNQTPGIPDRSSSTPLESPVTTAPAPTSLVSPPATAAKAPAYQTV